MYAANPVSIKNTASEENSGQGLGVNKKNPDCLIKNSFFDTPKKFSKYIIFLD